MWSTSTLSWTRRAVEDSIFFYVWTSRSLVEVCNWCSSRVIESMYWISRKNICVAEYFYLLEREPLWELFARKSVNNHFDWLSQQDEVAEKCPSFVIASATTAHGRVRLTLLIGLLHLTWKILIVCHFRGDNKRARLSCDTEVRWRGNSIWSQGRRGNSENALARSLWFFFSRESELSRIFVGCVSTRASHRWVDRTKIENFIYDCVAPAMDSSSLELCVTKRTVHFFWL